MILNPQLANSEKSTLSSRSEVVSELSESDSSSELKVLSFRNPLIAGTGFVSFFFGEVFSGLDFTLLDRAFLLAAFKKGLGAVNSDSGEG